MLHRLSEHDAACLRASCHITSFSGALRFAHDAIRALERSVCRCCSARGAYTEREGNTHAVWASLPSHAFSLTRRVTLHRADLQKDIVTGNDVDCTAWEQLAVLSRDVSLRVELALQQATDTPPHHTSNTSYTTVVHYTWHEGKVGTSTTKALAEGIASHVSMFTLRMTCTVTDLFYAMPVRRAAFTSPTSSSSLTSERPVSAAMTWHRRLEQRALVNTLFCSALEHLLGPLYLVHYINTSSTHRNGRQGVPRFIAQVNTPSTHITTPIHQLHTQCGPHGRRRAASLADTMRLVEGCVPQSSEGSRCGTLRGLEQMSLSLDGAQQQNSRKCQTPAVSSVAKNDCEMTVGEALGARILRAFFPALRPNVSALGRDVCDVPSQLLREVCVNNSNDTSQPFVVLFWQPAVLRWLAGTAFGRKKKQHNTYSPITFSCALSEAGQNGLPCLILSRIKHTHLCYCVEQGHKAYRLLRRYPSVSVCCVCCDACYLPAERQLLQVHKTHDEGMERFATAFAQAVELYHHGQASKSTSESAAVVEDTRHEVLVEHATCEVKQNSTPSAEKAPEAPHTLRLNYALHRLQSATLNSVSSNNAKTESLYNAPSTKMSVYRALAQRSACNSESGMSATMPGGCRTPIPLLPVATTQQGHHKPHPSATLAAHPPLSTTQLIAEGRNVLEMQRCMMPRIRALLGSHTIDPLGLLRHSFIQPKAWQPHVDTNTDNEWSGVRFPVQCNAQTRLMQWGRKFLLAVGRTEDKVVSREKKMHKYASTSLASCTTKSLTEVVQRYEWWLLEQHAVHERLRLEYFMTFAEAYVVHPELPAAMCMSSVRANTTRKRRREETSGTEWPMLQRLRAIERLMHELAARRHRECVLLVTLRVMLAG